MSMTDSEKPIEESKSEEIRVSPENLIRGALSWAKDQGMTIDRRAWHGDRCCGLRALLLQNKKSDFLSKENIVVIADLLKVSSVWIRAFMYGFEGARPSMRGEDGKILEKPDEAFELGRKLGDEFCGEASWKYF